MTDTLLILEGKFNDPKLSADESTADLAEAGTLSPDSIFFNESSTSIEMFVNKEFIKPLNIEIYDSKKLHFRKLMTFSELPTWRQDNSFILSGYLFTTGSYRDCSSGLFFIHNETGNIYSHFIGAVVFLVLLLFTFVLLFPIMESTKWTDILVTSVYLFGGVVCLTFSTLFHMFMCHSESVCKIWICADYVGINNRIWFAISPKFSQPRYRATRTVIFLGMGLSGVLPLVHAVVLYTFELTKYSMSALYLFVMGTLYVIGALVYVFRVPERWWPGKFDYFVNF
ncbi:hypothetical protein HK096_007509 [Nowakowskiella sp. JEL0078]|nr:hypothetical protein HK096_007509 [Nowakowskiella sp. JEL0078]